MDVTLQYFDGCPNWRLADERLRTVAAEFGLSVIYQKVETPDEAEALSFHGSPTVLVSGRDPFAGGSEPVGLACRIYDTPDGNAGSPTIEQLRAVLVSPPAAK